MDIIKTVWNWVVYSSANANKFSLTLKGIAGIALTVISFKYGIQNMQSVNTQVSTIIDMLIAAAQDAVMLISICSTIYGAFRKVILTAQGTAATLQ